MLSLEYQAAIDFVTQHHDIAIADRAGDPVDVDLGQHATGRVLRRIQNDQLGAVVNQTAELFDVETEIHFLA